MNQQERIKQYITEFGSISPMEAFNDLGITKLATRISEMRKAGTEIEVSTGHGKNRFGEKIHYSVYRFKEGKNDADKGLAVSTDGN